MVIGEGVGHESRHGCNNRYSSRKCPDPTVYISEYTRRERGGGGERDWTYLARIKATTANVDVVHDRFEILRVHVHT